MLEAFKRTMGKEHPGTLDAASDLATDLMVQVKLTEAETLFRRVQMGKEHARGREDIETLQSVSKLAQLTDAKTTKLPPKRFLSAHKQDWNAPYRRMIPFVWISIITSP